jgi:two-component system, cell cycle response regulator DivK
MEAPYTILYIEDNEQNMRLIRKILTGAGYRVIEANTGLEGVAKAAREHPHVILMDINLPDIDGLEATARLKASPELAWIPVIALTANVMHGDRERFIAAGCDGYIPKPVTKAEVLGTIQRVLAESSRV